MPRIVNRNLYTLHRDYATKPTYSYSVRHSEFEGAFERKRVKRPPSSSAATIDQQKNHKETSASSLQSSLWVPFPAPESCSQATSPVADGRNGDLNDTIAEEDETWGLFVDPEEAENAIIESSLILSRRYCWARC
jgi:hypothetical protein